MPSHPLSDPAAGHVVHASVITPERCCYITGLLDAARFLALSVTETTLMLAKLGVTDDEVSRGCVGTSRGRRRT